MALDDGLKQQLYLANTIAFPAQKHGCASVLGEVTVDDNGICFSRSADVIGTVELREIREGCRVTRIFRRDDVSAIVIPADAEQPDGDRAFLFTPEISWANLDQILQENSAVKLGVVYVPETVPVVSIVHTGTSAGEAHEYVKPMYALSCDG